MLAAGWGRIINVASINGKTGALHGAAYAATKHGLLGLTKTLALEVVRHGITVNAVCPGPVRTVMNDRRVAYDAQRLGVSFEEQEATMTPVGRRLEPEEVAPLAVFLAGRRRHNGHRPGLERLRRRPHGVLSRSQRARLQRWGGQAFPCFRVDRSPCKY